MQFDGDFGFEELEFPWLLIFLMHIWICQLCHGNMDLCYVIVFQLVEGIYTILVYLEWYNDYLVVPTCIFTPFIIYIIFFF